MYFYNLDTGALHIEGYCPHSKIRPNHSKRLETEDEAYNFAGQKIFLCKFCQKRRDTKLRSEM